MIQDPAVLTIIDILEKKGIDYIVSGSVASMFYAKPRMTHDIDLVINISFEDAMSLAAEIKDRYYVSEEGIRDALANKTMFNLIHNESGFKIDCWILTDSDFDLARLKRKQKHKINGREVYFSSAEDTLLIKLKWLKESGYNKHREDILDLVRFLPGKLDYGYIWTWIDKLGLRKTAVDLELPPA